MNPSFRNKSEGNDSASDQLGFHENLYGAQTNDCCEFEVRDPYCKLER